MLINHQSMYVFCRVAQAVNFRVIDPRIFLLNSDLCIFFWHNLDNLTKS